MATEEEIHRNEIRSSVERAIASGHSSYIDVLCFIGGAEPQLVKDVYNEVTTEYTAGAGNNHSEQEILSSRARRLSAGLPLDFPAPNPMASQWWFNLETVVSLSERVWNLAERRPAAFIGAPTVGFYYAHRYGCETSVLDSDTDIIDVLKHANLRLPDTASPYLYDVRDDVPSALMNLHSVVLVDPPWYKDDIELFVARARILLRSVGFILCVLPSRLTRHGLIQERTECIKHLLDCEFEISAIESDCLQYTVPEFELRAYSHIPEFSGKWWRRGDLLVLRALGDSKISATPKSKQNTEVFARDRKACRFFLCPDRADPTLSNPIEAVTDFSNTISTRGFSMESIAIWGSNKKGAKVKDAEIARLVLDSWQCNKTPEQTAGELEGLVDNATRLVTEFEQCLELWADIRTATRRRNTDDLNDLRQDQISDLAAEPTSRDYEFDRDGFRIDFQRDRDRVLWCQTLKRLAGKTQLFPVKSDDQLRRRLAHSIEVMQLASTIALAFGLDRELTEAGALAHDLGHTPFGHAGEHALDSMLMEITDKFRGFNHYEHGVDVVRWLEDVYQSPGVGGFPGLNLTKETIECIFAHTYYRGDERLGQRALSKATKHTDLIKDESCHLEGQAVRIADKISYVIADIEDGIRMGIIAEEHLFNCKLFERPPIDMAPSPGESLYDRFISQRRAILKVIMEDVLKATDRRLSKISSKAEVRRHSDYIVSYSEPLAMDISEIWNKLQAGLLHQNQEVIAEGKRAARIVTDLLFVYTLAPHLVDGRFRASHERLKDTNYIKWYQDEVGLEIGLSKRRVAPYAYEHAIGRDLRSQGDNWIISISDLVQAKDYVASLTDSRAFLEHRKHCGTRWE